jgi:hypothetical protein
MASLGEDRHPWHSSTATLCDRRDWAAAAIARVGSDTPTLLGRCDEWHVDIVKSPRENEMGEKGLTCSDGFEYEPIFGKEAQRCDVLTTDGFTNKPGFSSTSFCKTEVCRLAIS